MGYPAISSSQSPAKALALPIAKCGPGSTAAVSFLFALRNTWLQANWRRRIEASNVVTDDIGRQVPANLTVRDPRKNSTTELDGSRIKHDIRFNDEEFTPEALRQMSIPRSSAE